MSAENDPAPPQNLVQATGRVAEGIVGGLSTQPTLLLIVILNCAMIFCAGYYLIRQAELRSAVDKELGLIIRACILETMPEEHNDGTPRDGP